MPNAPTLLQEMLLQMLVGGKNAPKMLVSEKVVSGGGGASRRLF